jgi:hypothetical protein
LLPLDYKSSGSGTRSLDQSQGLGYNWLCWPGSSSGWRGQAGSSCRVLRGGRSTTMGTTPAARFATTTTPTTIGTTTGVGCVGVLLMTLSVQKAARFLPCCWDRSAVGSQTHGRGHHRHWGVPARPVPGRSPVPKLWQNRARANTESPRPLGAAPWVGATF